ncbi:hypothetical protein B0H11DRAFT_1931639 [Mycena galericulata]|nr:hypothetical protein B0H11DRAFT_1935367 [Mycena galericulata]KAJ7443507.1 hypothetical protein B0H11DRAFT_1931639 [Mycena galericulata]
MHDIQRRARLRRTNGRGGQGSQWRKTERLKTNKHKREHHIVGSFDRRRSGNDKWGRSELGRSSETLNTIRCSRTSETLLTTLLTASSLKVKAALERVKRKENRSRQHVQAVRSGIWIEDCAKSVDEGCDTSQPQTLREMGIQGPKATKTEGEREGNPGADRSPPITQGEMSDAAEQLRTGKREKRGVEGKGVQCRKIKARSKSCKHRIRSEGDVEGNHRLGANGRQRRYIGGEQSHVVKNNFGKGEGEQDPGRAFVCDGPRVNESAERHRKGGVQVAEDKNSQHRQPNIRHKSSHDGQDEWIIGIHVYIDSARKEGQKVGDQLSDDNGDRP